MKGYTNSVNINSKKNKKNFIYIHTDIVLNPKFDIVIDLFNVASILCISLVSLLFSFIYADHVLRYLNYYVLFPFKRVYLIFSSTSV